MEQMIHTLSVFQVTKGILFCICEKVLKKAPYFLVIVNNEKTRVLCSKENTCSCGAYHPLFFDTEEKADEIIDVILSIKEEFEVTVATLKKEKVVW